MKDRVLIFIVKIGGSLPLSVLRFLGSTLGWLQWLFPTRARQVTSENIQRCYPHLQPLQQNQLARSSLVETGKTIMETALAWRRGHTDCLALMQPPENKAAIKQASHQGLIFVIPHLGNWEMLNHYLGQHFQLTHMYQTHPRRGLEQFILEGRDRTGTRFVPAETRGIRAQLRGLKGEGAIGTMPDQEPDIHTGLFANFVGDLALTSTLIPNLWHRTQARMVIARCIRTDSNALKPFEVRLTEVDVTPGDITEATEVMNAAIGQAINEAPHQYLWSYKRFRTRPEGEPDYYESGYSVVRHGLQTQLMHSAMQLASWLPRKFLQRLTPVLLLLTNRKMRKNSRINIKHCLPELSSTEQEALAKRSLNNFLQSALATPQCWYHSSSAFDQSLQSVEGTEHIEDHGGLLVLTPPLGHREMVMRYLAEHYRVMEYYHPNSNPASDALIRWRRHAQGIALVSHTANGRSACIEHLTDGQVVTACPDQQPRLRGGEFVPFFGQPALTSTGLADMILKSQAKVVFASALPTGGGYQLHFLPCRIPSHAETHTEILTAMNTQLEEVVRHHPEQYRWHDKRFNIQPRGCSKIY